MGMSFARKCGWRSPEHMQRYLKKKKKKTRNVRNEVCYSPNFFPPYNTPEKRRIITNVLFPDEFSVPPPMWLTTSSSKDPKTSTWDVVVGEVTAPATGGNSSTTSPLDNPDT